MNDITSPATTTPTKPEPAQPVKASTKPAKPAVGKSAVASPAIKSSPVNPAWASEVAKAYGLAGPLAESVAAYLTEAVADQLAKATQPDKLTKLVKEAAAECIGKIG